MSVVTSFTLGKNDSKRFNESGTYRIVNQATEDFIEIVGGVNSTMLFELGPLSVAKFEDDNGIVIYAKDNDQNIPVTVTYSPIVSWNKPTDMSLKGYVFCIDAGHGGKDPGAVNGTHYEKDTALKICLKLTELLENSGASVLLTRDGDTYSGLTERANMANKLKCDAFISVHLNSAENKNATGYEVLVYNSKSSSKANILAQYVINNLGKAVTWPNRGIKDRPDLTVLKKTIMPAILVEVGFISNDIESLTLQQTNIQNNLAMAIYNGIKDTYAKDN